MRHHVLGIQKWTMILSGKNRTVHLVSDFLPTSETRSPGSSSRRWRHSWHGSIRSPTCRSRHAWTSPGRRKGTSTQSPRHLPSCSQLLGVPPPDIKRMMVWSWTFRVTEKQERPGRNFIKERQASKFFHFSILQIVFFMFVKFWIPCQAPTQLVDRHGWGLTLMGKHRDGDPRLLLLGGRRKNSRLEGWHMPPRNVTSE